jgi:hypothetical protein
MSESEYWLRLEFRLCAEFAGLPERRLRHFWCDGFTPQQYFLDEDPPCITGLAWICQGQQIFEQWEFVLFLDHSLGSRSEIDWTSLLPADNVTRWLAMDPLGKRIEIDPSAAIPDLA